MSNLTNAEIAALCEALDDEYRAWSTYEQVIADFGDVRPFSNIRDAESRHIQALEALFRRYGIPVPPNPWLGRVARYPDLRAACVAGVAAEIENGRMYERLLQATERDDIRAVLRNLQAASQERHLPAFRRCAERAAGGGGSGRGRHGRRCAGD